MRSNRWKIGPADRTALTRRGPDNDERCRVELRLPRVEWRGAKSGGARAGGRDHCRYREPTGAGDITDHGCCPGADVWSAPTDYEESSQATVKSDPLTPGASPGIISATPRTPRRAARAPTPTPCAGPPRRAGDSARRTDPAAAARRTAAHSDC